MLGDASKARRMLGWEPTVSLEENGRRNGGRGPRAADAGLMRHDRERIGPRPWTPSKGWAFAIHSMVLIREGGNSVRSQSAFPPPPSGTRVQGSALGGVEGQAPRLPDVPAPRRILLTGAGGFVGGHLRAALAAAWPDAAVLAEPFELREARRWRRRSPSGSPTRACIWRRSRAPAAAADEARPGTSTCTARAAGARDPAARAGLLAVPFVSSADAYGGGAGPPIGEDVKLAPRNRMPRPRRRPIWRSGSRVGRGCAWCGCGRSTTPGRGSRPTSRSRRSRGRSRASRPG